MATCPRTHRLTHTLTHTNKPPTAGVLLVGHTSIHRYALYNTVERLALEMLISMNNSSINAFKGDACEVAGMIELIYYLANLQRHSYACHMIVELWL